MALTQRLEIRQSHALVMTPQLMQAIKLLQLSNLDLVAYVENELEQNPLLERTGDSDGERRAGDGDGEAAPAQDGAAGDWSAERSAHSDATEGRASAALDERASDEADAVTTRASNSDIPQGYSEWSGTGSGGREDGDYNLEAFVSAETTLADHLAEQLALAISDPARRMIGQYLIDLVDEAGYLTGDLAQVGEKLGAPAAEVGAVLAILQNFDPSGVCARNLTECLAIQLKERNRFDPAMQALVEHLDLLAKRDLPALRKICGVGDED
ncbi:MAG: polymerase sigma-54 factor, partial [Alphaproteobacteria bacterium]|nr:polymerase sigma-54 factor [Alphaproteobacteria bacterium]